MSEAPLHALTWAPEELGDALGVLASELGATGRAAPRVPPAVLGDREALDRWVDDAATWLGIEAEAVHVTGADLPGFAANAGPAIVRVGTPDAPRYLVVRAPRRGWVRVVTPELREVRVRPDAVVRALTAALDPRLLQAVEHLLDVADIPASRRARVRETLVRERISGNRIQGGWLARLPPSASSWAQLAERRVPARVGGLALGHAAAWFLALGAWAMVGRGALQGRLDPGWLVAWALLVLSLVPIHAALVRAEGRLALDVGALLKQRLLLGALRLRPEEVRHQGMGQLLGRVIESEAVEAAATGSALFAAFALLELVFAGVVLASGAGGWLHGALLGAWVVGTAALAWVYTRRRARWSDARLEMTNELVEALVGHRTRLAQEDPARWHDAEDAALVRYVRASGGMDAAAVWLQALVPGAWIFLGLVGLAPALVGGAAEAGGLGVAVGGVLLAHGSLRKLVTGVSALAGAGIAWGQVRELFDAAGRVPVAPPPGAARPSTDEGAPLLQAHGVTFRHEGRGDPVLQGVDLEVRPGDRILLEGPSGGGKSTLGSLLAGLREPVSGLLLLAGLDRRTLGPGGWRRRVVTAPQFHENHVLGGPLAFNLLMGRQWPARDEDVREAQVLCEELGLAALLERMPSGMMQQVGETGWQLSHGEKSRLYIARALLQGADLVVLDESFAALDPDNLQRALRCVLTRAKAVLVIAHP